MTFREMAASVRTLMIGPQSRPRVIPLTPFPFQCLAPTLSNKSRFANNTVLIQLKTQPAFPTAERIALFRPPTPTTAEKHTVSRSCLILSPW